jgi:hypothetical protein
MQSPGRSGLTIMGELSKREDDWQAKATAAAVAEARKIVAATGALAKTPAGRLSDQEWGWIIAAVIFSWITIRHQQAIAEGLGTEEAMRLLNGYSPSPCDVAITRSILPTLADQASIDWEKPLSAWSRDEMTSFVLRAWKLLGTAAAVFDRGEASKADDDGEFKGDSLADLPF